MTAPQRIYLALVFLSSVWALVHVALVVRAFRDGARGLRQTVGLLFPPSAPLVAARHGERTLVLVWVALLVAYLVVLFAKAL